MPFQIIGPIASSAADGQSAAGAVEQSIGLYNGTTVDRLKGSGGAANVRLEHQAGSSRNLGHVIRKQRVKGQVIYTVSLAAANLGALTTGVYDTPRPTNPQNASATTAAVFFFMPVADIERLTLIASIATPTGGSTTTLKMRLETPDLSSTSAPNWFPLTPYRTDNGAGTVAWNPTTSDVTIAALITAGVAGHAVYQDVGGIVRATVQWAGTYNYTAGTLNVYAIAKG